MRVREYAVPLQALLAVMVCFSLIWMIYAMAFFDSTPPTAAEIKSLSTEDPEINDMKTAAALTVNAIFGMGPTQILLPTATRSFTPTLTFTTTATATFTVTNTLTPTPHFVASLTPTKRNVDNSKDPTNPPPAASTRAATPTKIPTPKPPTNSPPTEKPTDRPTDEPTEPPTEEPTDEPTEPPATSVPAP